jgi:outer membrane protein insertion porin family
LVFPLIDRIKNILKVFFLWGISSGIVEAEVIRRVEVKGNQRVDQQSILDYFPVQKDHDYSAQELDEYLKVLFKTGLFSDVTLKIEGETLKVTVVENRCLNQIVFEGNKDVSDEDMRTAIKLHPREICTPARVQEATQNLLALYRAKGRYVAQITPKLIHLDFNRVDLVFEVNEGPKSYIRSIYFVGNKKFNDATLTEVISSKEARWYRFLNPIEERYDPERIRYDCELLRQFYLKEGYADFRIISSNAELSTREEDFFLTYTLEEGPRYKFGDITIKTEVSSICIKGILDALEWGKGDWFNVKELQQACEDIGTALNNAGNPFIEVVPITTKDDKNHTISVQFVVKATARQYVDSIQIIGNIGTNDTVIRRELEITERDPLNPAQISASETNLRNLDFFESVDITDTATSYKDLRVLQVKVKEKSTGDIQFGAGFSTTDRATGKIGYTERNFLGRGDMVNMAALFSQRGFNADVGFSNPYLFGRPLTGGVDVSYSGYRGDTRGTFKEAGYKQQTGGIGFNASYALRKNLYQGWSYKIRRDRLVLRDPYMSVYLQENLRGHTRQWLSAIAHDLFYDRVKKLINEPVGGFFFRISNDFSGVGGNVHYLSNMFVFNAFQTLDEQQRVLLRLDLRYGIIAKMGYMRFADQYVLGGFSFPGFAESGVGPRDLRTGDALGGKQYYTASLKLYFPVGLPKELPVKGVIYVQSGSLWDSMFKGPFIGSNNFQNRTTCGGGIIWTPPMLGKLGVIFTKCVEKQKFDTRQAILFIWGQEF